MRNNYEAILLVLTFIGILALGIVIGRKLEQKEMGFLRLKNNQISFPLRSVGVGVDIPSASTSFLKNEFPDEYENIRDAAARNNCVGEDLLILFAIRKAENGPPGNEFGIMCQKGTNLDTQTGWAAATIMKNRERWTEAQDKLFGYKGFIVFLGNRYCPSEVDKTGNINWIRNVTYWYEKFKNDSQRKE